MKVNEIIEKSITIDNDMPNRLSDPDNLSLGIAEQGNLRSLLGRSLARLEKETAQLKAHLKFTEANRKKTLTSGEASVAVNKAELEIEADPEIQALRQELIEKEYAVNLIKIKRDDIKVSNDGYRTRMAFIREEIT